MCNSFADIASEGVNAADKRVVDEFIKFIRQRDLDVHAICNQIVMECEAFPTRLYVDERSPVRPLIRNDSDDSEGGN